jgi:hypothetical protein
MATLKELVGAIQYDSSWGIWAATVGGKFTPESEARYGQCQFENGGLLDEFEFFADGVQIGDHATDWAGELELCLSSQWDEIVIEFEKDCDCEWGGNRKEVERWAEESEIPQVVELVEAARADFDDNFSESDWIDQLVADMNNK